MRNGFKAIIAASVLGASSIATVAPAEAHDATGAAIVAGIIGLGIGAAVASDHHRGYDRVDYYGAPSYGYGYQNYGYAPSYGVTYDYRDRGRDWRRDEWRRERHDDRRYRDDDYGRGWRR